MQVRILLCAVLAMLFLTLTSSANSGHAIPGLDVLAPGNTWSSYGPYAVSGGATNLRHLILKFYTGDAAEYAAFQAGGSNGVDVADGGTDGTGPPAAQWPIYDNTCGACTPTSPGIDWTFTPSQGGGDWQGISFNGASTTWLSWGCNFGYYNSACGIELRRALAHLINRPDFVTTYLAGGTAGDAIWDDVPSAKVLNSACFSPGVVPCDGTPAPLAPANDCPNGVRPTFAGTKCAFSSPFGNFCLWDTVSGAGCGPATGPYLTCGVGSTLAAGACTSTISGQWAGPGFPSIPDPATTAIPPPGCPVGSSPPPPVAAFAACTNDFVLAAEHMVLAGVATGMDANYQIGAHLAFPAGVASNHLRVCIGADPLRRAMGNGWTYTLKLLLGSGGSPNVNAVDTSLSCGLKPTSEPPLTPINDWDVNIFSNHASANPFPVYLYTEFSTKFSFTPGGCGGAAAFTGDFPNNPTFMCIDGRGAAGNADAALLNAVSTSNEVTFDHRMVLDAGSALDILGKAVGDIPVDAPFVRTPALRSVDSLVNSESLGFNNPVGFNLAHKGSYTPVNSQFQFNNGGSPDTIRWGQAQSVKFLNPFQANSPWELNVLGLVYDTVLKSNPVRPQEVYCEMCQTIQSQSVVCGATTCTAFTFQLRQNLRFQDGSQVTASDVAFSYLNFRDYSATFAGNLALLDHITIDPNNPLKLQVVMLGQSLGHLGNLASVPIIPMNGIIDPRWACPDTGISTDGSTPCNPAFYNLGSTTIPQVDQYKAGPDYDLITDTNMIGSGLMACISDRGIVGTGCTKDSNGYQIGQGINPGGSLRLTVFDLTATLGSNAQYTRLNNPDWSVGGSRSGQRQEFLYADKDGNNQVTLAELSSVNLCYGASGATPNCPLASYNYWLRSSLHPTTPATISIEAAIVAEHYLDTCPSGLTNLDPC